MTDAYRLAYARVSAYSRLSETDENLTRLVQAHRALDFERAASACADVFDQFNPQVITIHNEAPTHVH